MEKLELKDSAPYLPYGLKFILTEDKTDEFCDEDWFDYEKFKKGAIWELCGYAPSDLNIYIGEGSIDGFLYRSEMTYVNFLRGIKPILRPLSDLINNILDDNNDANYRLNCELAELLNTNNADYFVKALIEGTFYAIDHRLWNDIEEFLNKNHFDWKFGLIEKGLAISIHDVE